MQYSTKAREIERLGHGVLFGSRREPNVVEIRQADLGRLDFALKARVLAFDWWIANSDRVFTGGAGNPNLLWAEDQQRLVVIDHNLAFDPSLMDGFWTEHAFRDARDLWSGALRDQMITGFRAALSQLQTIWNELPEDWTEVESGLTLRRAPKVTVTREGDSLCQKGCYPMA
jgi:hypothetical protein